MRAKGRTHRWAFTFAHRARCAAAIFFRAARLILRTGLDALAGFILPCAQRCFISRDIFLRAAALMRPRLRGMADALGGRPTLRRPVELTASIARIASSSFCNSCCTRSLSDRKCVRIRSKLGMFDLSLRLDDYSGRHCSRGNPRYNAHDRASFSWNSTSRFSASSTSSLAAWASPPQTRGNLPGMGPGLAGPTPITCSAPCR